LHVCEILAGQAYPEQTFAHSGQKGGWHRAHGERLAEAWIEQRGTQGFDEWDSPVGFERTAIALSHLADLAQNEELGERAAILLDKLFFTFAVNSFKGIFGSTHAHAQAVAIKSGQLEITAGITRLLWGAGTWNQHIAGLVALASSSYELPTMIASIAVDLSEEMWHKEHHPGVDKVTYRTPDYMLCSAQDYRPGERGSTAHIWQATLGPNAVCFTTHPPKREGASPNYWTGSGTLPRAAQVKNVVLVIYKLSHAPALYVPNRLFLTHAWLPRDQFDEVVERQGWVFARKGEGYLALRSQQPYHWQEKPGEDQGREIVAPGDENIWLCELGRKAVEGDFETFMDRIVRAELEFEGLNVSYRSPSQGLLEFGWSGPLRQNGQVVNLGEYPRYDNPYVQADFPMEALEVRLGKRWLRLDWGRGERVVFEPLRG